MTYVPSILLRSLTTQAAWAVCSGRSPPKQPEQLIFCYYIMKSFLASSRTFFVFSSSSVNSHLYLTKETVTDFNPTDCDRYLLTRNIISKSPTQRTIVIGKLERRLIRTSLITWPCMTLTFRCFVTIRMMIAERMMVWWDDTSCIILEDWWRSQENHMIKLKLHHMTQI